MLLANLVYEVAERKFKFTRVWLDTLLFGGIVLLAGLLSEGLVAAVVAVILALVWINAVTAEVRGFSGRLMRPLAAMRGRVPLPVPQLIVTVRGPVLERGRSCYSLGDWPAGLEQPFQVMILNPSIIRPQLPLTIEAVTTGSGIAISSPSRDGESCPAPGEIVTYRFMLKAVRAGQGGEVRIQVQHGDFIWTRRLRIRRIIASQNVRVKRAFIQRWKYGTRGAFVWRGDQDLYDPATFQSEEGLRAALGLGRRFRMPSSLMLSARLSLVQEEHRAFCGRFGWDRQSEEIPAFIRFLKEDVDTAVEQEWPTADGRPFSVEIGNHMYLHYGTHAAADVGNGWTSHAGIGAGAYPWMDVHPCGSFEEQRDNAKTGSRVLTEAIGVRPTSFTIPSDVYDGETARAVEAAGIEVASETDCGKFAKQLLLPPPHHPQGCDRLVELTRMSPRDPENVFQLAMLKFWVGAVRRTGRVLVYLAHHHLARYEGEACYRLTEELFRHVLADQDGDIYVGTLTAVGRYWRDVLSERTRCVSVTVEQEQIVVVNVGACELTALPVEVVLVDGGRYIRLVTVRPHNSVTIEERV